MKLDHDHLEAITKAVESAVKVTVNGKIDKLDEKMSKGFESIKVWGETVDKRLDNLQPAAETITFLKIGRKGILWVSGFLVAIGSLIVIIKGWNPFK